MSVSLCADALVVDRLVYLHNPEVNQAAGVVSVQADCSIQQAFVLMIDRAGASRLTVDEIAAAVLDHSIRFGE